MSSALPSMLEVDPTFDEDFCPSFEKWCERTGYDPKTRQYAKTEAEK